MNHTASSHGEYRTDVEILGDVGELIRSHEDAFPAGAVAALARAITALNERKAFGNRCPTCVIADEQVRHAKLLAAEGGERATYCRELAIVALRMLKRAGRLKPTTDDERAAVELANYELDLPAANRRLAHPGIPPMSRDEYVAGVVLDGQAMAHQASSSTSNSKASIPTGDGEDSEKLPERPELPPFSVGIFPRYRDGSTSDLIHQIDGASPAALLVAIVAAFKRVGEGIYDGAETAENRAIGIDVTLTLTG